MKMCQVFVNGVPFYNKVNHFFRRIPKKSPYRTLLFNVICNFLGCLLTTKTALMVRGFSAGLYILFNVKHTSGNPNCFRFWRTNANVRICFISILTL